MNKEIKAIKDIQFVCQRLYLRNMLAGGDGNVSFRLLDKQILITPSRVSKAFFNSAQMAKMNLDGKVLKGIPSSEFRMHLAVYRQCPLAKYVIHAHPPTAVAWSVAFPKLKQLPQGALAELILNVGQIPIVPFAMPSTEEMGKNLRSYLPQNRVLILARHGALSWGENLEEAMNGMERIEHCAQILFTAKQLGKITSLPKNTLKHLFELRKKLGQHVY